MSVAGMKLTGVKGIERALNNLPDKMQKAGERAVLRAGAKPILTSSKTKVPSESGLLKKALGTSVRKVRGIVTARVGARKGRGRMVTRKGVTRFSDPVKYSHLVEYGTSHSSAKPFIRPAVEGSKGQIVDAMADGYSRYLHRTIKRLRKK